MHHLAKEYFLSQVIFFLNSCVSDLERDIL